MDRFNLNARLFASLAAGALGFVAITVAGWGSLGSWIALSCLPAYLGTWYLGFRLVNRMNGALSKLVIRLAMDSNQIANASRDISLVGEDLLSGTQSQLAALKETADSIERISLQAQKNAANALETSQLSQVSLDSANRGLAVTREMVDAMVEIQKSQKELKRELESGFQNIRSVIEVIDEIALKTKVIDEIVLQSKILSFNAAVEAARAGEHGKGFLVVAQEVNKLAQLSGTAAKEMTTLLSQSRQRVTTMVENTTGVARKLIDGEFERSQTGLEVAEDCAKVLQEIVRDVGIVDERAKEIVALSSEQSHGVQKVSRAAIQLESVTRANVESAAQGRQAAEGLDRQSQSLSTVMKTLSQTIKGKITSINLQDESPTNVIFMDEIRSQNGNDQSTADRRR